MKTISIFAALLSIIASAVLAADWSHYVNDRYGYAIDIPPGFSAVAESDNGDGGTSMSADGRTKLSVWGAAITQRSFTDEIAWRIDQDSAGGWHISYDRQLAQAASWSGSQGDRILYQRSIMGCDGAAIYFRLEYDKSALKAHDAIVRRLVKSLTASCSPALTQQPGDQPGTIGIAPRSQSK